MLYNKSPIMWKSKMQKTTALSTAEAEYYSASTAGCEVLYLRVRAVRSCTSGTFCADSDSGRGSLTRSTRITRRVLNGETTSSEAVNEPSTSTFGSTYPTR